FKLADLSIKAEGSEESRLSLEHPKKKKRTSMLDRIGLVFIFMVLGLNVCIFKSFIGSARAWPGIHFVPLPGSIHMPGRCPLPRSAACYNPHTAMGRGRIFRFYIPS